MKRTIISSLPLTLVTIVECGSISAAADALDMARSAVSQNLKRLENQLGVKLAARTTRQFHLTPAGEIYYRRCKEMLSLAKIAATEMEAFGATPSGTITITAPHAMINSIVAPAISDLMADFPNLSPRVLADDRRLDLIAEGIDLAISVGPLRDSALKARKIGEMQDVLCGSADLIEKEDVDSNLQKYAYIAHAREPSNRVLLEMSCRRGTHLKTLEFEPRLSANTVDTVCALVRNGTGIAILPSFLIAEDIATGRLVRLHPDYSLGVKEISAVHVYDSNAPKSISTTIERMKKHLQKATMSADHFI